MSFWNSLYLNLKEFRYLFLFGFIVFVFNIFLEYNHFLTLKEQKYKLVENALLLQYYPKHNKNNKKYWVLKLKTKDFVLYSTSFKDLNLSKNQLLNLKIITSNISFKDYLKKSFYVPSYGFEISGYFKNNAIVSYFLNQHTNEKVQEFYGALFFALPISSELRKDVNHYGIAHLIAISGYHIALLFTLVFFILTPLYSFFQKRYFPYRNLRLDLSVFIFILLFAYAYLIGFVPSYIRSLIMALWAFYLLCKNIKILSFFTLFISIYLCIALYPRLLLSVGFLFSCLGVFYIFLYLHHFLKFFHNFLNIVLLNIWTFFCMIIPVLYFFPLISYQQFLAIILSGIFIVFYPLVLCLHFVAHGNLLDTVLIDFLNLKFYAIDIKIPTWILISYLVLSFMAMRYKILALLCVFANFIPFILIVI
ncbi:ComEC/Rec2 family competence protein [Campylobacter coli]|nr:ComEC/Rec2 family competence protein [Campylobacter coli]EAJ6871485.1 ComEC/Rec2 family competence protein [Campylobacter coli]EAK1359080.1 ComEC/Rec2 family competence protein [Campylobacter coli]EAW7550938.1 ComEC/Rec2 family competence protein [Campylobacter coli]EGK8202874.1 ComEC/Rec2 family competence protein [Campylobacter coli]